MVIILLGIVCLVQVNNILVLANSENIPGYPIVEITVDNIDRLRLINADPQNPARIEKIASTVRIIGNGGCMAYVKGIAIRYPVKAVLSVTNISGTAGLALSSGYFDGSYSWSSTRSISYRLVVTINETGSYVKIVKWRSGTYVIVDTAVLSSVPPFRLIIERNSTMLLFLVEQNNTYLYTFAMDVISDNDIRRPGSIAIPVNANSMIEFSSLKIYRTDIVSILDYLRKIMRPYGVVDVTTLRPVDPSSYTPAVTPGDWSGVNDIVFIPYVDETLLSEVVTEIKSRSDWKEVLLNWNGTVFYRTPTRLVIFRLLALLGIVEATNDMTLFKTYAKPVLDYLLNYDFVTNYFDENGTLGGTDIWCWDNSFLSIAYLFAYVLTGNETYLNKSTTILLDWRLRVNNLPYDRLGDDSYGTRYNVAWAPYLLALAYNYLVTNNTSIYDRLITVVNAGKQYLWSDVNGMWWYRDTINIAEIGYVFVDPVLVFVSMIINDTDLLNKAVSDYEIKSQDRTNDIRGLLVDGIVTHGNWDLATYKVYDALYWFASLARVADIVMKKHGVTQTIGRNPIDYIWHEIGVYAPGYPNTLPGEVSSRFPWYNYVQTNLFLVPALSSTYELYNGTLDSFIEHIGIIYLPIAPVPKVEDYQNVKHEKTNNQPTRIEVNITWILGLLILIILVFVIMSNLRNNVTSYYWLKKRRFVEMNKENFIGVVFVCKLVWLRW